VDQTHASDHPTIATATETHSKQSKARRVVEEVEQHSAAQHSKGSTHTQVQLGGGVWRWFIKNPRLWCWPTTNESRPTSPQTGAGVGREATKLPRYFLRSHQYHTPGSTCPERCRACTPPKRQRQGKGSDTKWKRGQPRVLRERQPRLAKLTHAGLLPTQRGTSITSTTTTLPNSLGLSNQLDKRIHCDTTPRPTCPPRK